MDNASLDQIDYRKKNLYIINEVFNEDQPGKVVIVAREWCWQSVCRSLFTVSVVQEYISISGTPTLESINSFVSHYLREYDAAIENGDYNVIQVSENEEERMVSFR
jgi:hypothetical protein